MPFEAILKIIFESGLESFNSADYKKLDELILPYAELISPEVNLPKIQAPAVHLKGFDEIIAYWSAVNANYENRITRHEYLELGKISRVRCHYEKVEMVIDSEIHFDNYAKISKIINRLVEDKTS
jgi:hypothetical protein